MAARQAVQLVSREWIIADGRGARHEVRGEGVVGEQPVLEPGALVRLCLGLPADHADRADGGALFHDRRRRLQLPDRDPALSADRAGGDELKGNGGGRRSPARKSLQPKTER